mmetsp:Transcript_75976/g.163037  ORF Transcript_75976/g.163037 Transcript_75976/m.163037 type:complete len:312 (+) Transcript_75976:669-1604(+)
MPNAHAAIQRRRGFFAQGCSSDAAGRGCRHRALRCGGCAHLHDADRRLSRWHCVVAAFWVGRVAELPHFGVSRRGLPLGLAPPCVSFAAPLPRQHGLNRVHGIGGFGENPWARTSARGHHCLGHWGPPHHATVLLHFHLCLRCTHQRGACGQFAQWADCYKDLESLPLVSPHRVRDIFPDRSVRLLVFRGVDAAGLYPQLRHPRLVDVGCALRLQCAGRVRRADQSLPRCRVLADIGEASYVGKRSTRTKIGHPGRPGASRGGQLPPLCGSAAPLVKGLMRGLRRQNLARRRGRRRAEPLRRPCHNLRGRR